MELNNTDTSPQCAQDVENYVFLYLLKQRTNTKSAINDKTDYRQEGYVDSLSFMKFISALEQRFSIEFSDEDIISEELRTVRGVIDCITRKMDM